MENQIQELTDLLYNEGVAKGNAQAEVIVNEAKQNAAKIVAQARAEAEALLSNARKEQDELKSNTVNELKLYAGQTVEAIKAAVTTAITNTTSREAAEATVADTKFLQEVILRLVSTWSEKEELVIGTEDAKALRAYFATKAKALLDKGIKVEEVNGLKHAFTVAPADGAYKIVFGENEFEELFRDFLRPALAEMLYK
jgi:V/A-type H+-transporting ATPase subunit E